MPIMVNTSSFGRTDHVTMSSLRQSPSATELVTVTVLVGPAPHAMRHALQQWQWRVVVTKYLAFHTELGSLLGETKLFKNVTFH